MSLKSIGLSDELHAYVLAHNPAPDPVIEALTAETRSVLAAESLARFPSEAHLDFAFIDADKVGYPVYWAEIVPRMRPGGVILVDNVLRGGRVVTGPESADDEAMLAFNDMVTADERVDAMM